MTVAAPMAEDYSAVPEAMRARPQWLLWRSEPKPGKPKPFKMPYYANGERRTGVQGSPSDRSGLVPFTVACTALAAGKSPRDGLEFTGLGFAFLPGDGLIGIDIDGAIDAETGEIAERASNIISACASYTEYSPSRKGVHIIVEGQIAASFKSNDIGLEVFCGSQYFTVTGMPYPGTPPQVATIDESIIARLKKTVDMAKGKAAARPQSGPPMLDGRAKVESALAYVSPESGYEEWIQIGMAIHAELGDGAFSVWDYWSAKGSKYPGQKTLESHWKSFKPGKGISGATIFKLAMNGGWRPPKPRLVSPEKIPPSPLDGEGPAVTKKEEGKKNSSPKPEKTIDWNRYEELLGQFVLIYGTDTCYDLRTRILLKVNHLRLAFGSDYVKMWLAAGERRMILPAQLIFSPSGQCVPPEINLFDGIPSTPKKGDIGAIMELLRHLCGDSAETDEEVEAVVQWCLKWLALPLQKLGIKMRSALVFHGPQGAGKNLFFEIVASIYGRYALVVGQDQLEDKFNDWASQKLFLIGDEVVARQELYHNKNKLKAFITGETIQINTKMMPLRTEANHVNVVFLSNEHQPLALEVGDRRYFVVYTPPRRVDDLYLRVAKCLTSGGSQAFHEHLLNLDLGGFSEFDIPPMTAAKRDLIDLGLKPAERFVREWLRGYLPLPLQVCSVDQLYQAFKSWAMVSGERFPPPQDQFSKTVNKTVSLLSSQTGVEPMVRLKPVKLDDAENGRRTVRIWIPVGCGASEGTTEGLWAYECVQAFRKPLGKFFESTGMSSDE